MSRGAARLTVNSRFDKMIYINQLDGKTNWNLATSRSLRTSPQTGVAIPRIDVPLFVENSGKRQDRIDCMTIGYLEFDGDSHTSVRAGSE